jgi:hypothetical protein
MISFDYQAWMGLHLHRIKADQFLLHLQCLECLHRPRMYHDSSIINNNLAEAMYTPYVEAIRFLSSFNTTSSLLPLAKAFIEGVTR